MIVEAGARLHSFRDAAYALSLAGLSITASHIHTLTQRIGLELAQTANDKAQQRRRRETPNRVGPLPDLVAVEVDGGRLRTRQADCGPGVHHAQNKEDKVACLVTLKGDSYEQDPQPEPPPSFLQPRRVERLVRQMAGQAAEHQATDEALASQPQAMAGKADAAETPDACEAPAAESEAERWSPKRLVRTCVASMVNSQSFGPLVAGEAHSRGFYEAKRRAFVGDGQAYNWAIQRGYFPDFVAVVDFLHVLCYLYQAALTLSGNPADGWDLYRVWLRACWQGGVAGVIQELWIWQGQVGPAPPGEDLPSSDPRRVVSETLSYLLNNQGRMDYPRYRQQGLPITSSLVESLVGEFNARVKSKQKYWNQPEGGEAILQVRAAVLSQDDRLAKHFAGRPGSPYRRRKAG